MQGQTERRKAEFQKVEDDYKQQLAKNPYTDQAKKSKWSQISRNTSRARFNNEWNKQRQAFNQQAQQQKIEAEKKLRFKNYTEDGYNVKQIIPSNAGKDAFRAVQKYKNLDPRKTYSNKTTAGFNTGWAKAEVARQWLLEGKLNINEYQNIVGSSVSSARQQQQAQAERAKAKSRAKLAGEVKKEYDTLNETIGSFATTKAKNDLDVSKLLPSQNFDNMTQKQYTKALREGKVNLATALLNQRTAGGYKGPNTVNIETFLTERGYDINKPEEIPDSIFKPEKQLRARAQASKAVKNNSEMGDLRLLANTYSKNFLKPDPILQTKKFKANDPLEFMGPTNPKKIENFKLMDNQPLNLSMASDTFGRNMQTGEIQRLKTYGETYSPEMQFFGEFIKGSRNTFDSYGNLITNTGNFLTGKPQQPMSRPPVQDQFFGAVIDSAKNTFEGRSENRASDPMGEFFNVQKKRIDKQGFGQVAGELTTEALFWALPVGAVAKIPKIATSFFSPTVKATKASKAFTPGGDFMKLEGKTKDVSWGDQIGAFFGPKGPKTKSQPFTSSNVPLGASLGKGPKAKGSKKTDSNNFFGGSSGTGKKFKPDDNNFFKEMKVSGSRQVQLQRQKQIPKTKKGGGKMKSYPVQLGKSKQQFFKPIPKQKQLPKLKQKQLPKQQFFKPIPLITPKTKVKQRQKPIVKQNEQFFKPIPKLTPMITPKQKAIVKQKPITPTRNRSTGMFLPPIFPPFFRQGGLRNRLRNRKRPARKAYTAWNVNTKQVGSFLKGPSYKKSRSTIVFDDLDRRTKRAKKEKDYDYLDFF